jgi:simple sugar transport system substrate-binding protein
MHSAGGHKSFSNAIFKYRAHAKKGRRRIKVKGKISLGTIVMIVMIIVAAIVGGVVGYVLKPAPPEVAELQATIDDLEGQIDDLEAQIAAMGPWPNETIKVAFVCHGSPADACWIAYHNGANALAQRLKNVEVVYRYSVEDVALQADMIDEEIARGVDAIIVSIADATALDAPIQRARDAGIVVIAYDTDDPEGAAGNARQAFITSSVTGHGLCYDTSYLRGKLLLDYFGGSLPADCDIFFPNEGPGATWSDASRAGLIGALEEAGYTKDVDYTLHEIDASYDVATAQERITAYITAHPELDVIVPCGGCTSIASVLSEEALGMQPGDLPIFSWPHGEVDARGIQEGLVIAGVTDSHSSVGAIALYEAIMAVQFGVGPVDVTMPLVVVNQDNIDQWAPGWTNLLY